MSTAAISTAILYPAQSSSLKKTSPSFLRPSVSARLSSSPNSLPSLIRNEPVFAAPAPVITPIVLFVRLEMESSPFGKDDNVL